MGDQAISQAVVVAQDSLNPGTSADKLALFNEDGSPFASSGGSPKFRKFPFDFTTPSDGVDLWTPEVGEMIVDAWLITLENWDGINPSFDFGQFIGQQIGLICWNKNPLSNLGFGALTGDGTVVATSLDQNTDFSLAAGDNSPLIFTRSSPVKLVLSQDGTFGDPQSAIAIAAEPVTLPAVITDDNKRFVIQNVFSGDTEDFVIAPGTYDTIGDLSVAATAATTGETTFGDFFSLSNDGETLTATAVSPGWLGNQWEFHEDSGALAILGFGDTQQPEGGLGGEVGATQGSSILVVSTVVPV